MKVLILGSGMYVTGKGQAKTGTILASVIQASKTIPISKICVVSYSPESETFVKQAAEYTNSILGTSVVVEFYATKLKHANWLEEFIKTEHFDFSINSLPDHLHFEFAKLTLTNNIPSLIVKPLTPTLKEGQDLLEIANKNKVYCAVEFHKRWDESNLYLKESIQQKRIGELLYFDVNYSQRVIIPSVQFATWAEKTNIFQYLGVHYVDLIYFLTGKKPKKLSVYGTKKKLVSLGINTWDSVHVSSIWGNQENDEDDFYAHFNLNWIDSNNSSAMSDQKINVIGTEGRIDCNQKNRGIEETTNLGGVQSINPYFSAWLPNSDGTQQLNGYGFRSIFTFISDVYYLKQNKLTLADLNINRPSIAESLVSTKFIEAVTNQLRLNNSNQIDI